MSGGLFLNIKAPKELLERLDDYRFATRKPSRAAAARELLDRWRPCPSGRSRPASPGSRGPARGEAAHLPPRQEGAPGY
jgi:hypothetical protein